MKWFQKILTAIAMINLVVMPAFGDLSKKDVERLNAYGQALQEKGYEMTYFPEEKMIRVYKKGSKDVAMEVPFAEEETLRKFSPKSLNQMMLDEMVRVKAAAKSSWSHSVKNLPTESAIFFMAMGAVVAGQLITNYSQNPIAMKQHIEHSLSPIGVFGFFTFMYSQGVTSNVLAMYMQNPKFHHMIPYLGMTVGAFVQSYLSQILSDPNVMACANTMMGKEVSKADLEKGIDADPCSKAYEYLVIKKKIWEFAPGIVSMLISSGLAAVAQSVVTKTVLRLTGVDIALWLVPGTMQLKGIRLLLVKGLQITIFVAIDAWLNRKVTYVWKNMYDGAEFFDVNDGLNEQMNLMKKDWNGSDEELQKQVKDFRKKMLDWRMMNMSEVYEAHQNWSENLLQLTSMYNSSYSFYNSFIDQIRNSRFQLTENKFLENLYPLSGVIPKGLTAGKEDLILSRPAFIENLQLETVADVAKQADALLAEAGDEIYGPERDKAYEIVKKLHSTDRLEIGKGIYLLNSELGYTTDRAYSAAISFRYPEVLRKIRSLLGTNPEPMLVPGRGFGASYELAPSTAAVVKDTNFYRAVGYFQTPKITDYLVMQMLCGPDVEKGQKVVRNSRGFPSVFLPPQIKNTADDFNICNSGIQPIRADNIYRYPLRDSLKVQYQGVTDYLIKAARPSIVGEKDTTPFPDWWTQTTESQMQSAFEEYAKNYDDIVVKLVKDVYYEGRSIFNGRPLITSPWEPFTEPFERVGAWFSKDLREKRDKREKRIQAGGPIYNGGMNSAIQEERTYLALLNELFTPSYKFDLDMSKLVEQAPTHPLLKAVDNQFGILNALIKRIKVVEKDGRERIQSDLENSDLQAQLQNIQGELSRVGIALGVTDANPNINQAQVVTLTEKQRNLAVTTLEQLQGLASEVMMYGSMANAVSWDKIRNVKNLNMEQQKFNNEVQEMMNKMRGVRMPGKL